MVHGVTVGVVLLFLQPLMVLQLMVMAMYASLLKPQVM